MARRKATPKTGFARIKRAQVAKIRAHGGKTVRGKRIRDPGAYIAAGLRRTGIKKYGRKGFATKQKAGRKKR